MNQNRGIAKRKNSAIRLGRNHSRSASRPATILKEKPIPMQLREERFQSRMDLMRYTNPFPPPHIMEANNRVDPRINDVLINGMNEEMEDRRHRANFLAKADVEEAKRAQIFALIASLGIGLPAVAAIFAGHDVAGGGVATGVIVAVAIAFLSGPRRLRKDKDEPAE